MSDKKIIFGNNRSNAMNRTIRTWKGNWQKIKIDDKNGSKHVMMTARQYRTYKRTLGSQVAVNNSVGENENNKKEIETKTAHSTPATNEPQK